MLGQFKVKDKFSARVIQGERVADEMTIEPEIGFRISRKSRAEVEQEEESRKQYIGRLVSAIMDHVIKNAVIAELQSKHPCSPFSEESKTNDTFSGETWKTSTCSKYHSTFQCPYCLTCWMVGIVIAVLVEFPQMQYGNETERHDVLTILHFAIKKDGNRGARHGRSEEQ